MFCLSNDRRFPASKDTRPSGLPSCIGSRQGLQSVVRTLAQNWCGCTQPRLLKPKGGQRDNEGEGDVQQAVRAPQARHWRPEQEQVDCW